MGLAGIGDDRARGRADGRQQLVRVRARRALLPHAAAGLGLRRPAAADAAARAPGGARVRRPLGGTRARDGLRDVVGARCRPHQPGARRRPGGAGAVRLVVCVRGDPSADGTRTYHRVTGPCGLAAGLPVRDQGADARRAALVARRRCHGRLEHVQQMADFAADRGVGCRAADRRPAAGVVQPVGRAGRGARAGDRLAQPGLPGHAFVAPAHHEPRVEQG